MAKTVMISSFRGGTGKSTITSNIASSIASLGKKILIIDTDIYSPGIHAMFGLDEQNMDQTFTDYLLGNCKITDCVYDVSSMLGYPDGQLLIIPATITYGEIAETLQKKDIDKLLMKALDMIHKSHDLDYVFIDTHPGINTEMLLGASLADLVINIIRPDKQDMQGAAVTADLMNKLDVKSVLVVNKIHSKLDITALKKQLESSFTIPVVGMLPFSEDLLFAESSYVFSAKNHDHPFSDELQNIASNVFGITQKEHLVELYDLLSAIADGNTTDDALSSAISVRDLSDSIDEAESNKWIKSKKSGYSVTRKGTQFIKEFDVVYNVVKNFGL